MYLLSIKAQQLRVLLDIKVNFTFPPTEVVLLLHKIKLHRPCRSHTHAHLRFKRQHILYETHIIAPP